MDRYVADASQRLRFVCSYLCSFRIISFVISVLSNINKLFWTFHYSFHSSFRDTVLPNSYHFSWDFNLLGTVDQGSKISLSFGLNLNQTKIFNSVLLMFVYFLTERFNIFLPFLPWYLIYGFVYLYCRLGAVIMYCEIVSLCNNFPEVHRSTFNLRFFRVEPLVDVPISFREFIHGPLGTSIPTNQEILPPPYSEVGVMPTPSRPFNPLLGPHANHDNDCTDPDVLSCSSEEDESFLPEWNRTYGHRFDGNTGLTPLDGVSFTPIPVFTGTEIAPHHAQTPDELLSTLLTVSPLRQRTRADQTDE